MALDFFMWEMNAVSEDEGQDWYDESVKEKVSEKAYANGSKNEEGIASPFEAGRFEAIVMMVGIGALEGFE
jgi:CRISPR/Cas system-associated protein Csx1